MTSRTSPTDSRTRACANSSSTSSASGSCSTPNPPEPTSPAPQARRPRGAEPPPRALLKGIEQFNAGEFFEQHETLELLWRDTRAPIRGLYHGILQIGVGFHHWRNGNHHGASVLLEEGIERLRPFAPACQGVDVGALIVDATRARDELLRLGPEGMRTYD